MARVKKTPAKKKPAAKSKAPAKKKPAAKKAPAKKKTAAKKTAVKKAPAKKKPAAKKAPVKKKTAAKKTAVKKTPAKKKAAVKKAPAKKKTAAKKAPAKKKTAAKAARNKTTDLAELFAPLSEGERADSLRILLEDIRMASMAKVGRYRVIAIEPLALKSTPKDARRLARIVIYDYAADRCVEANVDLDSFEVRDLSINRSQPMLAVEEETAAMEIAILDQRVRDQMCLGEVPIAAMHYWSQRPSELSHDRRTAAVLLGQPGARPTLVAIVDLLDAQVTEVVPGQHW